MQPKNVTFPTDAKLLETAIQQLGKLAKDHGVPLRQSYGRLAKRAAMMAGRYAHAKQFKRMNRQIKFLRTRLGRIIRDIRRKIEGDGGLEEAFAVTLSRASQIRGQKQRQLALGKWVRRKTRVSVDKGDVRLRNTRREEEYDTWEIQIEPGGTGVWEFVPEVAGRYKWRSCHHAGMVGDIEVLQAANSWPLNPGPFEKTAELQITLGTDLDKLVATPDKLSVVTGRYYKLFVKNPSFTTHYFWAPGFGSHAVWTDRISVDNGEVKLRNTGGEEGEEYYTWEIQIEPGGTAVWTFVPEKTGRYYWGCSAPEHAHAGMVGEIEIQSSRVQGLMQD